MIVERKTLNIFFAKEQSNIYFQKNLSSQPAEHKKGD